MAKALIMFTALMSPGVCRRKRTALTEHKTAFTMKTVKLKLKVNDFPFSAGDTTRSRYEKNILSVNFFCNDEHLW